MATGFLINGNISRFEPGDAKTSRCAKCGVEAPASSLRCLPEVCDFAKQLTEFMHGAAPEPKTPSDPLLRKKYGYGADSVFCAECLSDVTRGKLYSE